MTNWLGLSGRTCIVTGARGGLGLAITEAFLEVGARVLMLDLPGEGPAPGVPQTLARFDDDVAFAPVNVGDCASVVEAFANCQTLLGAPAVLVNNAALSGPAPLSDLDLEVWQTQMNVNVGGYLRCAQAFRLARDSAEPGAIINIASIAGRNAQPNSGGYAMGKAAILMLNQQLAVEWGPEGIRSNSVSPGLFRTPLTERFYEDPQDLRHREEVVPMRRIGKGQELAEAVVYLASQRASYVNGAELIVDGGFSQTLMGHIPRSYQKG
ncbi:SDR family NAD(P)-dependent oxidoreductase [Sulfitobacter sp. W074]|uniref:SDR family NAD(P)-dependent oxidoreductase n=1 Tax=Sulfitobacter sp. W074 TaxID=2867026 RepID=UPI0021A635DC|nr:SDR family oxidoreductase [Sulfitobacter sp. W074]UWR39511.1 SDR family oxidoreductase [Sulfitobacter sp. W074]